MGRHGSARVMFNILNINAAYAVCVLYVEHKPRADNVHASFSFLRTFLTDNAASEIQSAALRGLSLDNFPLALIAC
jgi:hypothetical protein